MRAKKPPLRWEVCGGGHFLTRAVVITPRPHGGLKEILRSRKAPGAKVTNPADGKVVRPPPASE